MLKKLFKTSLFIILSVTMGAQAEMIQPKKTGLPLETQLPELSVIDIKGNKQSIKQLSSSKGLILIFFRSADWCPFCKKHLIEFNQWHDKFEKLGYSIAGLSYDSVETLKHFSDKQQLKYPLLADQQYQTMQNYQVLNQDYQPGSKHYGIPYPGIMITSPQGKLKYKYFYQGYKKRVNLKMLYNQLKQNMQ